MTEDEESERRQKEFADRTELFVGALDVDEMVAQLLASEGFANFDEVAYVERNEVAAIEGFDDETAEELQLRAREYLDALEAAQDEERKKLGVADDMKKVPGVTTAMMVVLGKEDVKTVEDFGYCAVDDLLGWSERKDGEVQHFDGILKEFDLSRAEAEEMIIAARLMAGILTEDDLKADDEDDPDAAEAQEETTAI